jgi:hypothetical protein
MTKDMSERFQPEGWHRAIRRAKLFESEAAAAKAMTYTIRTPGYIYTIEEHDFE